MILKPCALLRQLAVLPSMISPFIHARGLQLAGVGLAARNCASSSGIQPSSPSREASVLLAVDSSSNIHLLKMFAALRLLRERRATQMRVLGVANHSVSADFSGRIRLSLFDPSGRVYNIDMGTAFAMEKVPLNLLSVSQLLRKGPLLHFE